MQCSLGTRTRQMVWSHLDASPLWNPQYSTILLLPCRGDLIPLELHSHFQSPCSGYPNTVAILIPSLFDGPIWEGLCGHSDASLLWGPETAGLWGPMQPFAFLGTSMVGVMEPF